MRSLWPQWRHAIVKVCSIVENRDSRFSSFDIETEENQLDTDVNQVECQQENLEETQEEIHDIESVQMATVQTHRMDANDPIDLNDLVGSSGSTTGTGRSWIYSQDVET